MPNRTTVGVIASLLAIQLTACGSNAKPSAGNNSLDQTNNNPIGGTGNNDPTGNGNPTDNSNVTTPVTLAAIAVSPADTAVAAGMPIRFTAIGTYSDGSTQDITGAVDWASADTSCAVAGATANELQTETSCANAAPFNVTATDAATGVVGSTTLTVVPQALDYIAIDQLDPTILIGTTLQLTVTGYFPDGSSATVSDLGWTSSNPSAVSVDPDGTIHGLALGGPVTVTATATGTSLSTSVNVTVTNVPHVLSYMTLNPGSVGSNSGRVVTGRIFLTSPADPQQFVTLTSSDGGAIVTIPSTVTFAQGAASATFQLTTVPITQRTKVTITATNSDPSTDTPKTARLNVRRAK